MGTNKQPEQPEHGAYDVDEPDTDGTPDYDADELDETGDGGEQA